MQVGTKRQPELAPRPDAAETSAWEDPIKDPRGAAVHRLQVLWQRRQFLSRAAIAGLLLGTLLAFVLPKRFESTAQLMPPDSQSNSGMALLAGLASRTGNSLGAFAGDLAGMKSSGALFIGVLRSRSVEDRLVDRFELRRVYGTRLEEGARLTLSENTSISEDRKSGIITIAVTDHDPARAATLAQAYVEELDRVVAQLSTSSARREREFLEDRLKTVQADLENAEKEFGQFASNNTAIDIKEQGKAMVEAAATLEGQLIAAKSELEGLKQIYTDNNIRVRATRARVTELQNQLEKIGGKGERTSSPGNGEPGNSFYPSIRKLPLLGITYADLYRRTKVEEAVYEALTQQYELAKVQEVRETPSVKVLDPPSVPEKKSFPPRLEIMFLCTFLAFAGATALTLGKAHWEKIDAQDPRKVLANEVLQTANAQMPWAQPNGSRFQAMTHRIWVRRVRRNASADGAEDSQNRL
ncbi:MAG: GumC family protein [Candidatus Acidiferrales bacterium]